MEEKKSLLHQKEGVWKRFVHTIKVANIPLGLFAVYCVLNVLEGVIAVKIPEVNGNFFAGDVSVSSVAMFIGCELLITVIVQFVLYINHVLRYKMNRNLRNGLWGKILKLKPAYYDKVSSSLLISRITVDSDALNSFVLDVLLGLVFNVYYLILTIYEMNKVSIRVGLMLLAFVPLQFVVTFVIGRINLKFESMQKGKLADLTAYLSELIACLPLLKSMNRQAQEYKRGEAVVEEFYRSNRNLIFLDVAKQWIGQLVSIGPELVIFILGIRYLNDGTFNAAAWYMFYLYAGTFISFTSSLTTMWENTKSIQGQLLAVSDVLYEQEESTDPYVAQIIESDDIHYDDVSFAYEEKLVLDHVSFTIPHHQNTILIGYSGAGKSTILKLLERMYEPKEGRILIGGENIQSTHIKNWRANIAYVSQQTPLLSGSIKENILYGIKREVSQAELDEVARLVHLDNLIQEHPQGWELPVGQFGQMLSGGQRQKVSVARAILAKADIMILDEPTASLDIVSRDHIMDALKRLHGSITMVIVSHDSRLVQLADHVVVVESGKCTQEGSIEQMKQQSEYYQQAMGEVEVA